MTKAIQVHGPGDASVLTLEEVSVPPPAAGEVQLRQTAIGVNFIDVYHRTALYPLPLPFTPGQEGAGVVTVLGAGVSTLRVGQRVASMPIPACSSICLPISAWRSSLSII